MSEDFELVPPNPAALVESLRAFGYSVETSIADLIDNSITAKATKIEVDFYWDGENSNVRVFDNGIGMTEAGLRAAMKPGSANPLDDRNTEDLGRFGLGLKTASFSHARSLTVVTKAIESSQSVRRWDLDHVGRTAQWQLLLSANIGSEEWFESLNEVPTGTVVLWENLDRIVEGSDANDEKAKRRFYELRTKVGEHLGVVFHRFISDGSLEIFSNGNRVEAWDPFLQAHPSTQRLPQEQLPLRSGAVMVQGFVLPHHSRLSTDEHKDAAGPNGWNASQGFYLYRANRMISHGGWLVGGLKIEEHHKLARLAVDISQDMDGDWDIDVRKARARPPGALRDDLLRIARAARSRAVKVYRHRGKIIRTPGVTDPIPVWIRRKTGMDILYRIDRKHAVIAAALDGPREQKAAVRAVLDLVEQTIPVTRITVDAYETPDALAASDKVALDPSLRSVAEMLISQYLESGETSDTARTRVMNLEPFFKHPEVIDEIILRLA